MSADNAVDDVNSLAEILLVGNAEHQINTAFVLTAEIGDSTAGYHAVRDIYYFIVKSNKLCWKDPDVVNNAFYAVCDNVVTLAERLCEKNDEASCNVWKAVLESKTDGNACRTYYRDDRCHGYSQNGKGDYNDKCRQYDVCKGFEEALCSLVNVRPAHAPVNEFHNELCYEFSHQEDHYCDYNCGKVGDYWLAEFFEHIACNAALGNCVHNDLCLADYLGSCGLGDCLSNLGDSFCYCCFFQNIISFRELVIIIIIILSACHLMYFVLHIS